MFKKYLKIIGPSLDEPFGSTTIDGMIFDNQVIQKAMNGDGDSFFSIGEAYYPRGFFYKAMDWYRLGASKNNSASEYQLGVMHEKGQGFTQDYRLSKDWYLKAHNNRNTDAANNIGMLYDQGKGVVQNKKRAFDWLLKAAEGNNATAAYNIAMCYEEGQGVDKNNRQALEWYEKSAKQGYKEANFRIEHPNQQGFYLNNMQKRVYQMEKNLRNQDLKIEMLKKYLKLEKRKRLEAEERELNKDKIIKRLKQELDELMPTEEDVFYDSQERC